MRATQTANRVSKWTAWVVCAAVALAAGCTPPAPTAAPTGPACDGAADLERCDPDAPQLRQRCVGGQWVGIGLCPAACREFALPADATPLGALLTACVDGATDVEGDGVTADATDAQDAAEDIVADIAPDEGDLGDVATADSGADDAPPLDGEVADGAPLDSVVAACGNGLCESAESAASCAWDCADGAQTAVACMLAKCPGPAQVCQAQAHCTLALAQLWWCAKGCTGCLAGCLGPYAGDVVTFSVASCSAAACLGTAP